MSDPGYTARLIDESLGDLFGELPALLITGPRAAGKTTTAARLAATVVRLDRQAEAEPFRDDPDAALRSLPEPVLLDEWQAVPQVLGAVKRAVDQGHGPARFLVTGSVHGRLDAPTWPGTGRLVHLKMWGLAAREILGSPPKPPFLQTLSRADLAAFHTPADAPDLLGYVELALRGGYPEPVLRLRGAARERWLESYLSELFGRDAEKLDGPRDPELLRRYFEAMALNSAGIARDKTIYDAAGISRSTAVAYDRLLGNMFVLDHLPAWNTNRLSRLVKAPKRYLTDTSLFTAALHLDERAVMRDGNLLGRLIETYVLAQIRPELELTGFTPRLYHLREKNGRHEVDLIAELAGGDVVAIEVKSSAAPQRGDARHLEWLRDELGERFLAGAVLHTGPRPFRLAERIFALPICSLWGGR
ncbi:MAG: ATP-binding protein, partial [Solirubrobacteraceae bacterium]